MLDSFLPFAYPTISEAAIAEVVACLKSGWITTGPRVEQFTRDLQDYFQAPYVLPLMSATSGLHFSLLAMGVQPGDEVITTPLTFIATLNAIVLAGCRPVLVDIDPQTFNMNIDLVEAAITDRTRVLMPVHFAGLPVDLDRLYELADAQQLRVLEDAAHAMGAGYKNRLIGSTGDTQIFSFHPNKQMTTGEGGCIVTRDEALATHVARLCFHGMDRPPFWHRNNSQQNYTYTTVVPGYKSNMTDIQAALGIHQLKELEDFLARRQVLAQRYQEALSDWPQWTIPQAPHYDHVHAWHLYTPLLNTEVAGMDRDEFMRVMHNHNIGTGLHYRPAHLHPYYQKTYQFQPGDFPQAEAVCDRIVSLPLFPLMTDMDHDRVLDVMYSIFD